MPKNNTDWSKTIMYKIVCNDLNITDEYTGSTINFRVRKNRHKRDCNDPSSKNYNEQKYQIIRNNGGWDNWSMILIEEYPCNSSLEARSRERYWQEQLNTTMNTNKAQITDAEYYENNKERILNNNKIWKESNKDIVIEYSKNYQIINKEKIAKRKKEKREKDKLIINL